ncbi:MAG: hypothetical protein H8D46_02790 [FCB group bacterium]|nr:hypothetical protein [FCB group bacterium]
MSSKNKYLISLAVSAVIFCILLIQVWKAEKGAELQEISRAGEQLLKQADSLIQVELSPESRFKWDIMRRGVKLHVDREYTFDVIPEELLGGLLFQGIHRMAKGTAIQITLTVPADIYFFFHADKDGGYAEIFKNLAGWKRVEEAPQYDIHRGSHGLDMIMYHLKSDTGEVTIPASTIDRACFSMVFQPA